MIHTDLTDLADGFEETGAEVGGYGQGKARGKKTARSGLWDEWGVGGVAGREEWVVGPQGGGQGSGDGMRCHA